MKEILKFIGKNSILVIGENQDKTPEEVLIKKR